MKQGAKANLTGATFEQLVARILTENSIEYKTQVKYTNLYGSNRCKIDFVVDEVYIECKFQNVSGSVDEKLPFCLLNLEQFENGMVILGGDHWYTERGEHIRQCCEQGALSQYKSEVILFEDFAKRIATTGKII